MSADELYQQAVLFAKQGQTDQALHLLKQYLKQAPSDVRGWWAFANLTTDADLKRKSLGRVLQLQPDHAKAKAMLAALDVEQPDWLRVEAKPSAAFKSAMPDPQPKPTAPIAQDPITFADGVAFIAPMATPQPATEPPAAKPPSISELQEKRAKYQAESPIRREKQAKDRAVSPLVVVLATIAVVAVASLGLLIYTMYFTGPDLSERASNEYVEIRYPNQWVHVQHDDFYHTLVMTTSSIPTEQVNPWPVLVDQEYVRYQSALARYEVTYWTHYFEWGRRLPPDMVKANVEDFSATLTFQRYKSDEYALAVVQVIPAHPDYNVNDVARAFGQWMEVNVALESDFRAINVETKVTSIKIDGHSGQFVEIIFTETSPISTVRDAIYIATVQGDEYGYLMLFSGTEQKNGEWKETALAMAESMILPRE